MNHFRFLCTSFCSQTACLLKLLQYFIVQGKLEVSIHTFLQDFILYFKCDFRTTNGPQTCRTKHWKPQVSLITVKGLNTFLPNITKQFLFLYFITKKRSYSNARWQTIYISFYIYLITCKLNCDHWIHAVFFGKNGSWDFRINLTLNKYVKSFLHFSHYVYSNTIISENAEN